MTLATQADVEAVLLRPLTDTEANYIDALLTRADGLIEAELPDVRFDGTVVGALATLQGNGTDELWLPGRPVTAVTTVTVNGETLDPANYVVSRWGPLRRLYGYWGHLDDEIAVTWNYGLDGAPAAVVTVAADLAKGVIGNPGNARQETIGQYSVTYATETLATLDLAPGHRRILGRYKRRQTSVLMQSANPWWGHGA